jgi:hypothetical protein
MTARDAVAYLGLFLGLIALIFLALVGLRVVWPALFVRKEDGA